MDKHWTDRLMDRMPGWPSERAQVTYMLAALIAFLLSMAWAQPKLWEVKLFEIILQGAVLTGFFNMVLAFHFAANKGDEQRAANTGNALGAINTLANLAGGGPDVKEAEAQGAKKVADAAEDEHRRIDREIEGKTE